MIYLTKGNRKLKDNKYVKFLIFNLPSQITCPFSTAECLKNCYAKKAERMYKAVLPCRMKNLEAAKSFYFADNMIQAIATEIIKPSYRGKEICFRIHESGDFFGFSYTKAWLYIAKTFPNVSFLAYTKSLTFFKGLVLPDNFTLRASVWCDTEPSELISIIQNEYPTFSAMSKKDFVNYQGVKCNCGSGGCGDCLQCWDGNIKSITIAIH